MAKISARGATEVARVEILTEAAGGMGRWRTVYVLRSDRVILRKTKNIKGDGYRQWGKLPTAHALLRAEFVQYVLKQTGGRVD